MNPGATFIVPQQPLSGDARERNAFGYLVGFGKAYKEFHEKKNREANMKTATKPASKLTDKEKSIVEKWCKHYDLHFWGINMNLEDASKELFDDTGISAKEAAISKVRKGACEHWGVLFGARSVSHAAGFTSQGWTRQINWLRDHAEEISSATETIASLTKRMRYAGVLCHCSSAEESAKLLGLTIRQEPPPFTDLPPATTRKSPKQDTLAESCPPGSTRR